MGSIVGTLHYDIPSTVPIHNAIRNYLTNAANEQGLNPNSQYGDYNSDSHVETFAVDLSGWNVWWLGKEAVQQKIDHFLINMSDYLTEGGLQNVRISKASFLPL